MVRPVMPVLEYIIDKDYIAEVLCINKEKTELNCEGKCYLMQQLKAQENNSEPNMPKISLEKYPIGFVYITNLKLEHKKHTTTQNITNNYKNFYSFLYHQNCFHPPTFS